MSKSRAFSGNVLDLSSGWTVSSADISAPLAVPGDVHTSLMKSGVIGDPYWRDTETSLDWIHEADWTAQCQFEMEQEISGAWTLSFESIDCVAKVKLNGQLMGQTDNQFLRQDFNVGPFLTSGQNTLEVYFASNSKTARDRANACAFPVPYLAWNSRLPHYNFLRKTQCDPGWDWNIALSPLGFRGPILLRKTDEIRLDDIMLRQIHHEDGSVTIEADVHWTGDAIGASTARMSCAGETCEAAVQILPGAHTTGLSVTLKAPKLWWPAGEGDQHLYDLAIEIGGEARDLSVGIRQIELMRETDEFGESFKFRVNGRDMFMRGANWIPADALPERCTPDTVRDLLQSAIDANMNMIRVWGGGQYEPDWFYQLCSEMGLLVWQDFMFACNLYPAHDYKWLGSVRVEAGQQVRRLSQHPCIALWCGDNELIGALNWFEESQKDRDRYLAIYARLNAALEETIADCRPDIPFWPSSPSVGPLDFGDGWHDDTSGDMHFWDVWHSSKDFEHYRTVRPRFCSEFGFQSFPSNRLIETFTDPQDRNVSAPVMDVHQRNDGGNSRIVETLARYFMFPDSFEDLTWLSQVSQALAMKTAIEFWRSCKPRTMGTLYWQLNDTWPVASWSSLEYGGGWKLVHYLARRFNEPVMITAQPDEATGEIVLWAVNDTPETVTIDVQSRRVGMNGTITELAANKATVDRAGAREVGRFPSEVFGRDSILHFNWSDSTGAIRGENDYLPLRPKAYDLPSPTITTELTDEGMILRTDLPAFFVTVDHGGANIWSDNCFTLLPGIDKELTVDRKRKGPAGQSDIRWLGR